MYFQIANNKNIEYFDNVLLGVNREYQRKHKYVIEKLVCR